MLGHGNGCRLWIDGEPVYHSDDPILDQRLNWIGDEIADVRIEGFQGLVDHAEIWEHFQGARERTAAMRSSEENSESL
jgi:hypothetical protein